MRYVLLLVGCVLAVSCDNPVGPSPVASQVDEESPYRAGSEVPPVPDEAKPCVLIVTYPEHPWYGGCYGFDGVVYDRKGDPVGVVAKN